MAIYCYNIHTNIHGNHEVHEYSCHNLPHPLNRSYLGEFEHDYQVMEYARKQYPYKGFEGCYFCIRSEHAN